MARLGPPPAIPRFTSFKDRKSRAIDATSSTKRRLWCASSMSETKSASATMSSYWSIRPRSQASRRVGLFLRATKSSGGTSERWRVILGNRRPTGEVGYEFLRVRKRDPNEERFQFLGIDPRIRMRRREGRPSLKVRRKGSRLSSRSTSRKRMASPSSRSVVVESSTSCSSG